ETFPVTGAAELSPGRREGEFGKVEVLRADEQDDRVGLVDSLHDLASPVGPGGHDEVDVALGPAVLAEGLLPVLGGEFPVPGIADDLNAVRRVESEREAVDNDEVGVVVSEGTQEQHTAAGHQITS